MNYIILLNQIIMLLVWGFGGLSVPQIIASNRQGQNKDMLNLAMAGPFYS